MAGTDGKTLRGDMPTSHMETSDHKTSMTPSIRRRPVVWKRGTWFPRDRKPSVSSSSSTVWFALLIADQITETRDLVNLACTSKAHYGVLIRKAYQTMHLYFSDDPVMSRRRGMTPSLGESPLARESRNAAEAMAKCWLDHRLVGRAKYLSCQEKKQSRYTSLLRFSGTYPSTAWGQLWDQDVQPPHPWRLQLGKLSDLVNLQEYRADVDWRLADMTQLMKLSYSLSSLTVPVRYPGDCGLLAVELKRFKKLASLTILSLPILDEFVEAFPQLADGLAARASSLRSLAVELTAHSRPYSWDTDDFVPPEPEEMDKYFRALFPTPSKGGRTRLPVPYRDPADPLQWDTVFRLESLELHHFGVPSDAFQEIFSKEHIKDLRLSNCKVHAEFWDTLKGSVRLRGLSDIDYDLLTPQLVEFLGSQEALEALTFSKPLPNRQLLGVQSLGDGMSLWYQTRIVDSGEAQHQDLRQLTEVALRNLRKLRSLHIPADMYNIGRQDLDSLCNFLPNLERIGLALKYRDLDLLLSFNDAFVSAHPRLRKITFLSCPGKDPMDLLRYSQQLSKPRSFCRGVRYLRYVLLNGERQTHYESQGDPRIRACPQHIKLDGEEGDRIFDEERTPSIYPGPRATWEIERHHRKRWVQKDRT